VTSRVRADTRRGLLPEVLGNPRSQVPGRTAPPWSWMCLHGVPVLRQWQTQLRPNGRLCTGRHPSV